MPLFRYLWRGFVLAQVLALTSIAADSTSFRIQDYVPTSFRDFQLRVGGGIDANGGDTRSSQTNSYSPPGESKNSQHALSTWLLTDCRYRHLTRPTAWSIGMSGTLSYSGTRTTFDAPSNEYQIQELTQESLVKDSYSGSISPRVSIEHFFSKRCFIAFSSEADLAFTKVPNDNSTRQFDISHMNQGTGDQYVGTSTERIESNNLEYRSNFQGELTFGTGRIDVGYFGTTALYMIRELKNHNLLIRTPSFQEYHKLADIIYQFRRRHEVDMRLLRIETFTAITSFLYESGVIGSDTRLIESYIQDVWNFFPTEDRAFGTRLSFGAGISGNSDWNRTGQIERNHDFVIHTNSSSPGISDTSSTFNSYDHSGEYSNWSVKPYLVSSFQWQKPVSLTVQVQSLISFKYYVGARDDFWDYSSAYSIDATAQWDYIANSRSGLGLKGTIDYNEYAETPTSEWSVVSSARRLHSLTYRVIGSAVYRLSIPTRLEVEASYDGYEGVNAPFSNSSRRIRHSYTLSAFISHYLY